VLSELLIGTATADITPVLPVALDGQFNMRIARGIATPLTANVIALESREGDQSLDMAVMVSCDLVGIPKKVLGMVRREVHQRLPSLDVQKIFLNAIHTHTAPVMEMVKIWHGGTRFLKQVLHSRRNMRILL